MFRFNFSECVMLFAGIFLASGFIGCSDNSPAPNDTAAESMPASTPSRPVKRPAPPPPPPSSAFESSPAQSSDAGQAATPVAEKVQPTAKSAAKRTYPPQVLPDAMTDIPAWAGKDKDEPFDVKKFLESRTAPPDNAAPLYFEAMAEIGPKMAFVYPPDQWHERLPKVKALAEDVFAQLTKLNNGSLTLTELERVLKDAKPVQEKIDKAQQKNKCIFITGMRTDSQLPHLTVAGQICDLEVLQIYHSGKSGNTQESEQAISRTLRLARDVCPRGCLVALSVSIDLEQCILKAINEYILAKQNLTTKECDHLMDLLIKQQRESIPYLQEALRMDYILGRNTINDLQQGHFTFDDLRKSLPQYSDKYFNELSNYFQHINWQDEISSYNQGYASLLGMADRPYYEIIPNRFETEFLPKLRVKNVHLVWIYFSSVKHVLDGRVKEQANLASTMCTIAVRKYEITHGNPPPNLSTAIPGTALKEIPVDPYSGKPMRYESNGKTFKILYGSEQKNSGESGN